jgi:hypothetical protein
VILFKKSASSWDKNRTGTVIRKSFNMKNLRQEKENRLWVSQAASNGGGGA